MLRFALLSFHFKQSMPSQSKIFLVVFCSVVGLVTLWAMITSVVSIVQASNSQSWPIADGTIVSSTIIRQQGKGPPYCPSVRYQYTVAAQEYVGNRIAFGALDCGTEAESTKIASAYPEGRTLPVHYDPESPSTSTLVVGKVTADTWLVFIFVPLLFMVMLPICWSLRTEMSNPPPLNTDAPPTGNAPV